ncbi:MAG: DUF736 domain-containing protein [Alphaproteobacteria bacterium]|nr:DUF736 domain-containing protein [Alphaproteobacteria bacterium]
MAVIGTFVPTKEGGWTGTIRTLLLDVKIRFVPNDNKADDKAPAFRIFAGESEIGAAWRKQSAGEPPREYLSVSLEDPTLPESISAALFESPRHNEFQLVWNRRSSDRTVGT